MNAILDSKSKVLFFIGAGASKACIPRMPTMLDFISLGSGIARRNLQKPGKAWIFWRMVQELEKYGDMDGIWGKKVTKANFEITNAQQDYHSISNILSRTRRGTDIYSAFKIYLDCLESETPRAIARRQANIEQLLTYAEEVALKSDDDTLHDLVTRYVLWLLGRIEAEIRPNKAENQYDKLVQLALDHKVKRPLSFVSFNYDVVLERALAKGNKNHPHGSFWHPHEGYGVGFERYFSQSDIEKRVVKPKPFPNIPDSETIVLKPHGSIYWARNIHGETWEGQILRDKNGGTPELPSPGTGFARVLDGIVYRPGKDPLLSSPPIGIEPMIVQPSQTKPVMGQLFWQCWKRIEKEIHFCDAICVIGWNMPQTDRDVLVRISDAIRFREKPIDYLIVCDLKKSDVFYQRFVAAFAPARKFIWKDGFTDDFISHVFPK